MPSPAPPQELLEEQQQHEQHRQEHEEGPARCASDEAGPIDVDEGEDEEEEDNADADADVNKQATTATAAAANDADDADADDADPNNDKDSASDPDLPRSILRKIIKARLSQVAATELGPGKEFGVSKEALEALGEGAKVRERDEFFSSFLKILFSFLSHVRTQRCLLIFNFKISPGLHLVHHLDSQRSVQGSEAAGKSGKG